MGAEGSLRIESETMSHIDTAVRYLRLLQHQMEATAPTDYSRGAARYLRWAADDVERFSSDELAQACDDAGDRFETKVRP